MRKAQLHRQIKSAIEENDEKQLLLLQGFWVHRYGLKSLKSIGLIEGAALTNPSSLLNDLEESSFEHCEMTAAEDHGMNPIQASDSLNDLDLLKNSFISPPPKPSISHLRRWLPVLEDEIPEAS